MEAAAAKKEEMRPPKQARTVPTTASNDAADVSLEFTVDYHSQGGMMSWATTKRFRNENIMVLLEEYVELMAELP